MLEQRMNTITRNLEAQLNTNIIDIEKTFSVLTEIPKTRQRYIDRERESVAETQAEGEAGSMQGA